jgi:hypothetical protein
MPTNRLILPEFRIRLKSIPEAFMSLDPLAVSLLPAPVRTRWDPALVQQDLAVLAAFPARLARLVGGVSDPRVLVSTYRAGGWTVTEIVHHLVDSHLHAYLRAKFALCEALPTIEPYDENVWVGTAECTAGSVHDATALLSFLHRRWAALLSGLDEAGWNRAFHHPERGRDITLYEQVASYAWHGEHHLAQAALALGAELPSV